MKSATVAGPNGNEIDTYRGSQTYEISTSISDSFEFQVKTDSQFDGEELQVTDVFIQAMTAEEWQSAENGLYGTDNQACY